MRGLKATVEVMSPEEVQLIHDSSLKILETLGINVPNKEILHLCEELGGIVDYEEEILKIPASAMEKVLDVVRQENRAWFLREKDNKTITANISTQVRYTDYQTRTSRYGLREDNLKGFMLVDTLKNFPGNSTIVVPSDVPEAISDLISFRDLYQYSHKPGGTYILTPQTAKYILELDRLMKKESWYFLETISPLSYKRDTLEIALLYTKNGGKLALGPMAMSSATAPASLAGALTMENAEILGSMFIIYAMNRQTTGYSAPMHSVDMKTMLCSFGSANQALFGVAVAQMCHYYGVLGMTNAGLTDALLPDFQSGFEKGVTAVFNFLAGTRGMGAQGIVGADQGANLEQLVIDNEWIEYYNYITRGFEVSADSIGLDTIFDVGIKGNFLSEEHTVEYMRESYLPSNLFLRESWDSWTRSGQKELLDRAHEYVESVTTGWKNREPVLEPSLCQEMDRIVACAEEEILGRKL